MGRDDPGSSLAYIGWFYPESKHQVERACLKGIRQCLWVHKVDDFTYIESKKEKKREAGKKNIKID